VSEQAVVGSGMALDGAPVIIWDQAGATRARTVMRMLKVCILGSWWLVLRHWSIRSPDVAILTEDSITATKGLLYIDSSYL